MTDMTGGAGSLGASQEFVDADSRSFTTRSITRKKSEKTGTATSSAFSLQEYIIPAQPRKGQNTGAMEDDDNYQVCDKNSLLI